MDAMRLTTEAAHTPMHSRSRSNTAELFIIMPSLLRVSATIHNFAPSERKTMVYWWSWAVRRKSVDGHDRTCMFA